MGNVLNELESKVFDEVSDHPVTLYDLTAKFGEGNKNKIMEILYDFEETDTLVHPIKSKMVKCDMKDNGFIRIYWREKYE